jgi:hypothetical protein
MFAWQCLIHLPRVSARHARGVERSQVFTPVLIDQANNAWVRESSCWWQDHGWKWPVFDTFRRKIATAVACSEETNSYLAEQEPRYL